MNISGSPTSIPHKTTIKVNKLILGNKRPNPPSATIPLTTPLEIAVAAGTELTLKCRRLKIARPIHFTVRPTASKTSAKVIIEFTYRAGKKYDISAELGPDGVFQMEKKRIKY